MITSSERRTHLNSIVGVSSELNFGKVQKSKAWPLVNALISQSADQNTSHLFQMQHDWAKLLSSEIDKISDHWGVSEFDICDRPSDLSAMFGYKSSARSLVLEQGTLSGEEYFARREALEAANRAEWDESMAHNRVLRENPMVDAVKSGLVSGTQLAQSLQARGDLTESWGGIFRKHIVGTRSTYNIGNLVTAACLCGKSTSLHDGVHENSLLCSLCGTKVQVREPDPEKDMLASGLLIPYPTSYFEFEVNDHSWIVEVVEQEDKTAVLKYYFFYSGQWLKATVGEYCGFPVFKALKNQVIGGLIALEAKAAVKTNHQEARPPKTPAMMERLRKVFKKEFNFGYSVIDLTKETKKSAPLNENHEPAWRVRLHFRIGYWRTRLGRRERVRWCLAGDPSLGFVDKHYRF